MTLQDYGHLKHDMSQPAVSWVREHQDYLFCFLTELYNEMLLHVNLFDRPPATKETPYLIILDYLPAHSRRGGTTRFHQDNVGSILALMPIAEDGRKVEPASVPIEFRTRLCTFEGEGGGRILTKDQTEGATCIEFDMNECNILTFDNRKVYHASPERTPESSPNPYGLLHITFSQSTAHEMEQASRFFYKEPEPRSDEEVWRDLFFQGAGAEIRR